MASGPDNLRRILDQSSAEVIPQDGVAVLKEKDPSKPYEIELRGLPSDSLLVKIENFEVKPGFLNGEDGILRRADFALVDDEVVVFLELKTGRIKPKEIEQQLHGAQCVLDYCASIGNRFFNDPNFLTPALENYHRVVLHKVNLNKRRSVPTSNRRNHRSFKTISCGERVYFKALVT